MSSPITWPTLYSTILLIAIDAPLSELEELQRELNASLETQNATFARGLEAVPMQVRPGLFARTWIEPARVFVLRCPRTLSDNHACVDGIASGQMNPELRDAATRVFADATSLALQRSARVAWMVADEWHVDDAVAVERGSFREFLEFVRRPLAWCTTTLSTARATSYVENANNELPFWYEVSATQRKELDASVLEDARGRPALVARYDCSLQRIAILLQLKRGYAYLVASGCQSLRGPLRWPDCQLTIATIGERTSIRDSGADFELICKGGYAIVETLGHTPPFDSSPIGARVTDSA